MSAPQIMVSELVGHGSLLPNRSKPLYPRVTRSVVARLIVIKTIIICVCIHFILIYSDDMAQDGEHA